MAKKITDESLLEGSEQSRMSKARNAADSLARNRDRDWYNEVLVHEAHIRGIEWAPKASPRDRARAQYEALLAEFPDLADGS